MGGDWLTLRVLEVVPPEGPDFVLPTDVPHREADVLVLHRLHVEACQGERPALEKGSETSSPRSTSCSPQFFLLNSESPSLLPVNPISGATQLNHANAFRARPRGRPS